MSRNATLIIAAIVLIVAAYAAVQYSGRMTTQPTENPTPPAATSQPVAPPAETPSTPPPNDPAAAPGSPAPTTP
jgi:hypothetical protein